MHSKDQQKVNTGIEVVRDMMDPLEGDPLLVFAKGLKQQITGVTAPIMPAIRGYTYITDATGQPTTRLRKDNLHDHAVDGLRYACAAGAHDPRLHAGRTIWSAASKVPVSRGPGRSARQAA